MKHKCRVFKYIARGGHIWITMCSVSDCEMRDGYLLSDNWEEAILEALHHRVRYS